MDIPADTLKEILALRKENGLDATEAAVKAALATVKWTLEETPRYRKAGRSPLYLPGKYLTAKSVDPVTGEADSHVPARTSKTNIVSEGYKVGNGRSAGKDSKVEETQFYRVLHGKGFAVKVTQNILNGEIESEVPPAIEKLGLQFGSIPANAEGIYITQTSPQIQVSMTLDKFLEVTGIKP